MNQLENPQAKQMCAPPQHAAWLSPEPPPAIASSAQTMAIEAPVMCAAGSMTLV